MGVMGNISSVAVRRGRMMMPNDDPPAEGFQVAAPEAVETERRAERSDP
jgi:hypothetical protein